MTEKKSRPWLRVLIAVFVGCLMVYGVVALKGPYDSTKPYRLVRYLCDGAFLTAVVFGGIGILVKVADEGFFDILTYAMQNFKRMFGNKKRILPKESYYDYKQRKSSEAKSNLTFLLFVALGFFVAAIALNIWFNNMAV
ncbi:MAG: DUF3899 domain-containing protein [Eubacteriales bacterium]|nr:DUF3899 domain-containing protein [Eubacteriales bacterium]MDD3882851.1 DUF3899 domain-containing protein [Eubacteriales bacterium]MDD4512113.1 DUF3899 domain-containing protein [Eubacteriales bacterium]